jgi:alanine racemase
MQEERLFGNRPTWALINLDALAANFQFVRERVNPDVKVMAVVKANAYGHGAVECATRLAAEGAEWFGVASPEEGIELREAGIERSILCLGGFWDGQAELCLRHNLVPVIYRIDMAESLDRVARDSGTTADVHVKIDTGMGRLGVRLESAAEFADALRRFKNIRVDGLMTHFAAADDPDQDCVTNDQTDRFRDAVNIFRARGFDPTYEDLGNSAGTYAHEKAWGNMVRPGGVLYGLWRDILPPTEEAIPLRKVMSLHSRIMLLKRVPKGETLGYGCTYEASRETLVATIPIGYHDGYVRALSNRGDVIVRGTYASVIGRISMDLTLLDVTDVKGVSLHDEVTLLGDEGDLSISAEELAKTAGTLSYEITCGISERVSRIYLPE